MGTLLNNATLYISTNRSMSAAFAAGTPISFRAEGSVLSGTLLNNTSLYTNTAHSQSTSFRAGTVVTFRPDGSVQ